jgi:hypothetical protein
MGRSREIANPLQSLIAAAGKSLPAATGETERYRARFEHAGAAVVVLADCSSSMAESAGGRTKEAILREALGGCWPELPGAALVGFASTARRVDAPTDLPSPAGGTALHLALDAASALRPGRTLVISDGEPDDEDAALAAAGRVPGRIDVIYCGPDSNTQAIAFMRRLATAGGGVVVVRDVLRESSLRLGADVRATLGLPAPGRSS